MPFTETFHGFIENTTDTLLIIEACRNGILPIVNRRLIEKERHLIKSGTIIVFDESASGIKRWTDGFLWSPSRILGNFLVYRELANKENRKTDDKPDITTTTTDSLLQQRERALVGSLTTSNTSYNFKSDGLIKKTIRIMVNGNYLHIISYYNKHDVLHHLLSTPSTCPELACLQISADLLPHLHGYPSNHFPSPQQQQQQQQIYQRKRSKSSTTDEHRNKTFRERGNSYDAIHQDPIISSRPNYTIPPNMIQSNFNTYYKMKPFTELLPPPPPLPYIQSYQPQQRIFSSSSSSSSSPSSTPSSPNTLLSTHRLNTHQFFPTTTIAQFKN